MRGTVTPRMLSFINRRHINADKLNQALKDIINVYNRLALPKLWGDSKVAAADGTKFDLYEENLFAEYHIRYGGYGGIAYHHVSDRYVALFSHFIPCGVWEAIYIIEGLLKNTSVLLFSRRIMRILLSDYFRQQYQYHYSLHLVARTLYFGRVTTRNHNRFDPK